MSAQGRIILALLTATLLFLLGGCSSNTGSEGASSPTSYVPPISEVVPKDMEVFRYCANCTDQQAEAFSKKFDGLRVLWEGKLVNAFNDGTLVVSVDNYLFSVKGIPSSETMAFSIGDSIVFEGTLGPQVSPRSVNRDILNAKVSSFPTPVPSPTPICTGESFDVSNFQTIAGVLRPTTYPSYEYEVIDLSTLSGRTAALVYDLTAGDQYIFDWQGYGLAFVTLKDQFGRVIISPSDVEKNGRTYTQRYVFVAPCTGKYYVIADDFWDPGNDIVSGGYVKLRQCSEHDRECK